jgi:hypothetical protein
VAVIRVRASAAIASPSKRWRAIETLTPNS